jgi:hypothetical protein
MNSYTWVRFSAPSRVRRRPRLFQDLLFQLQLGDLPAQPHQLGALVDAQVTGLPTGALLAQFVDPVAQGLVVDAQLTRHIANATGQNRAPSPLPGAGTPRGACSVEPTRILLLGKDAKFEDVRSQGATSWSVDTGRSGVRFGQLRAGENLLRPVRPLGTRRHLGHRSRDGCRRMRTPPAISTGGRRVESIIVRRISTPRVPVKAAELGPVEGSPRGGATRSRTPSNCICSLRDMAAARSNGSHPTRHQTPGRRTGPRRTGGTAIASPVAGRRSLVAMSVKEVGRLGRRWRYISKAVKCRTAFLATCWNCLTTTLASADERRLVLQRPLAEWVAPAFVVAEAGLVLASSSPA